MIIKKEQVMGIFEKLGENIIFLEDKLDSLPDKGHMKLFDFMVYDFKLLNRRTGEFDLFNLYVGETDDAMYLFIQWKEKHPEGGYVTIHIIEEDEFSKYSSEMGKLFYLLEKFCMKELEGNSKYRLRMLTGTFSLRFGYPGF